MGRAKTVHRFARTFSGRAFQWCDPVVFSLRVETRYVAVVNMLTLLDFNYKIANRNFFLHFQTVLLGLLYEELSWDIGLPSDESNEDCLPCLFLQFMVVENGLRVSKILQVKIHFSL